MTRSSLWRIVFTLLVMLALPAWAKKNNPLLEALANLLSDRGPHRAWEE